MLFAKEHLNYKHNKGLDFIGHFNGKYIIGEAKFLIDFGGHQNAQFNDAIATIKTKNIEAVKWLFLTAFSISKAITKCTRVLRGNSKMKIL